MVPTIILCVLLFLTVACLRRLYQITFYSPPRRPENLFSLGSDVLIGNRDTTLRPLVEEVESCPCERVTILSRDGFRLSARYYSVREKAPIEIMFHGYRSMASRDMCGAHRMARERGHNILLIDQRAHGRSEGKTITFGIREKIDCLDWARYASDRFGESTPLFLEGVSMGAATVLMASDLPLPSSVAGIIADCPYSSPHDIICCVGRQRQLSVSLLYPLVSLSATLFGGFRLADEGAVGAVSHTRIPLLILHGEDDTFVPPEMSRAIANAATGFCHRETFPGAGHAGSYLSDPDRYACLIGEFIAYCLHNRKTEAL